MPTPLRVLQVNSLLTGGGTDDQCLRLAHGLSALGEQVWIAGPGDRPLSAQAAEAGPSWVDTRAEGPLKLGFILRVARLIRRTATQIVHGHHGRDYWPTVLAARLSGRRPRVVLTRHLAKSPSSRFSRRFLLGNCDAMIAVSEFTARVLREGVLEPGSPEPERRARPAMRGDPLKVRVVYGGLDTERFRPFDATAQRLAWGVKTDDFVFAVVGGYGRPRGKGQREFLQAASRIHAQAPQARFLVVGRGDLEATLRADIASLGLTGKAWLTPYCTDMPCAMNAIDCLVHPQVGTEAFGLVLLEAFACGKPVIASALDGIPEAFAVGDVGQLVEPESVAALAAAMARQVAHGRMAPPRVAELHARVAAGFSFRRLAEGVQRIYESILRRGAAAAASAGQGMGPGRSLG